MRGLGYYFFYKNNMIEVEIRGNLSQEQFTKLKSFFEKNGTYLGHQDREMYLLKNYPGYSQDFVTRTTDIRLRSTNGECEIMLKKKSGENTTSRKEYSLPLKDTNLTTAKEIVKGFGCEGGLYMHRISEMYEYRGIQWLLERAPKKDDNDILFYEAEIEVATESEIENAHKKLETEALELDLEVLDDIGMRALIQKLDTEVNVWTEF